MSSSSDEDLSKFKEAADVQLFNDSLFAEGKDEHTAISLVKPSLRYLDTPEQNHTDLKVTPGFQKHVASHLMKILDSSLDKDIVSTCRTTPDHDSNGNCTSEVPEAPKKPEGGIKLFGASAAFLASCNIVPPPPTKRRKRGRKDACISSESEDDSGSNETDISNPSNKDSLSFVKAKSLDTRDETELSERFAACAVSPDWILNGDAVKGWAPPFKIKEPIQGEATPDLLKIAVLSKREKSKKKRKKEKKLKDDSKTLRERGKRGKKSKKKKVKESDNAGDGRDPLDNGEPLTKAPKKKKRRKESHPECRLEENQCIEQRHSKKCEDIQSILREFAEAGLEGTNVEVLSTNCSVGGKKKREVKMKVSNVDSEVHEVMNDLLKKMKKEMKKRRKGLEKDLPSAAAAEDEGFDSDPTKADKKRREQRKLLKAKLKKQKKKSEKRWQNKMEFLSNDLANLVMTNVKQD